MGSRSMRLEERSDWRSNRGHVLWGIGSADLTFDRRISRSRRGRWSGGLWRGCLFFSWNGSWEGERSARPDSSRPVESGDGQGPRASFVTMTGCDRATGRLT